jgi:hypothetical protein
MAIYTNCSERGFLNFLLDQDQHGGVMPRVHFPRMCALDSVSTTQEPNLPKSSNTEIVKEVIQFPSERPSNSLITLLETTELLTQCRH